MRGMLPVKVSAQPVSVRISGAGCRPCGFLYGISAAMKCLTVLFTPVDCCANPSTVTVLHMSVHHCYTPRVRFNPTPGRGRRRRRIAPVAPVSVTCPRRAYPHREQYREHEQRRQNAQYPLFHVDSSFCNSLCRVERGPAYREHRAAQKTIPRLHRAAPARHGVADDGQS